MSDNQGWGKLKSLKNLIKGSNQQEQQMEFDESILNFSFKGGEKLSQLIEVVATMKCGPDEGMPVPLQCSWYRQTIEQEFTLIEGITGAFYQPTPDDIGCKICVHAAPVSEIQEFTGMPGFAELGPIEIDEQNQQMIDQVLDQESFQYECQIIQSSITNLKLPQSVQLRFQEEKLSLQLDEETELSNIEISSMYPYVDLCPAQDKRFRLQWSPSVFYELQADKRDLIVLSIRALCGKVLSKRQVGNYIKLQTMSVELNQKKQECQNLRKDLARRNRTVLELEKRFKEQQDNISDVSKFQQQVEDLNKQIGIFKEEKKFLRQDAQVWKTQYEQIQQDLSQKQEIIKELERQIVVLQERNKQPLQEHKDNSEVDQQDNNQYEELQNQIKMNEKYYKNRVKSLINENNKLQKKLQKYNKFKADLKAQQTEIQAERQQMQTSMKKMSLKLSYYYQNMLQAQQKLTEEIKANSQLRNPSHCDISQQYQSIITSMTQTITDKDKKIDQLEKIIYEQDNRLAELQGILSCIPATLDLE